MSRINPDPVRTHERDLSDDGHGGCRMCTRAIVHADSCCQFTRRRRLIGAVTRVAYRTALSEVPDDRARARNHANSAGDRMRAELRGLQRSGVDVGLSRYVDVALMERAQ